MKVIFCTKDNSIKKILQGDDQVELVFIENESDIKEALAGVLKKGVLFIDSKGEETAIEEMMASLFVYRSKVKIVYLVENKTTKEIRELQAKLGDVSPDQIVLKPLDQESVLQIVNEFYPPSKMSADGGDTSNFAKDLSFVNFDKSKYLSALKAEKKEKEAELPPEVTLKKEAEIKEVIEKDTTPEPHIQKEKSDVQKKFDSVFETSEKTGEFRSSEILSKKETEPDMKKSEEPVSLEVREESLTSIEIPSGGVLLEGREENDEDSLSFSASPPLDLENKAEESSESISIRVELNEEPEERVVEEKEVEGLDFTIKTGVSSFDAGSVKADLPEGGLDIDESGEVLTGFGAEAGVGEQTLKTVISTIMPQVIQRSPDLPIETKTFPIESEEEPEISFTSVTNNSLTSNSETSVSKSMSMPSISFNAAKEIKDELVREAEHVSKKPEKPAQSSRPIISRSIEELEGDQSTLRHMRFEREELLREIEHLHEEKRGHDKERIELKAYSEDLAIELAIIKKRFDQEREEYKQLIRKLEEKTALYEEKMKGISKETDKLSQRYRVDHNTVKRRESELLEQLELVKHDTEIQIKSRDMKILELKRKIDALEFNMENISSAEVRMKEDKKRVEEKLFKVIKNLRGSIKMLEDDGQEDERDLLERLKKL